MDADTIRAVATVHPDAFARALADEVRSFTRRNPAPGPLPFFGFDHPEACGSRLLDRLSDLGIFRFYERVLDLGSGLGGPARWLARRRGCRVVSVTEEAGDVRAAARLNERAHARAQVSFVRTGLDALPFADASFTHAWSVEQLHRRVRKRETLAEVFRTLRPGGRVAIQDWVWAGSDADRPPHAVERLEAYRRELRHAGFVDVNDEPADDLREKAGELVEILAARLATGLAGVAGRAGVEAERERLRAVAEARRKGDLRLVQLFASRPS